MIRTGDIANTTSSVFCSSYEISEGEKPYAVADDKKLAIEGVDFVKTSQEIVFQPGQSEAFCEVHILDDWKKIIIEGKVSFQMEK